MACLKTPIYAKRSLANTSLRSKIGGYTIKYEGGDCDVVGSSAYPFHNDFLPKLDQWAQGMKIWSQSYGGLTLSWIGHFGTYRDFSGSPSWHYRAKAWDISSINWTNGGTVNMCAGAHADDSLGMRRRYLAIEALLRKRFRTVLNGYYNEAHENHFHVDIGCDMEPMNTSLRSHTLFMQLVAKNFMARKIAVDGVWGPATQAAYLDAKDALNLSCLRPMFVVSDYKIFLNQIARHGFANRALGYYQYSSC